LKRKLKAFLERALNPKIKGRRINHGSIIGFLGLSISYLLKELSLFYFFLGVMAHDLITEIKKRVWTWKNRKCESF